MKSPFPGMDPYIEACGLWEDFHDELINEIKRALAQAVPARYLVRTRERSYVVLVESEGKATRPFVPDVSVTTQKGRKKPAPRRASPAVAEHGVEVGPVVMRAFIEEEHREAFVEIYEATAEQRLVTSIEVLSPSNKRPRSLGRKRYLRKRKSLLLSEVNLVEIDLLRGGERMPMLDPWPASPYTLLVARAKKYDLCKVWPAYSVQALPSLPVSLAIADPDIVLHLQSMLDAIYQRSRYERSIDYRKPSAPPLSPEETAWLERRLRARPGKE
jgi:hypothetical protein